MARTGVAGLSHRRNPDGIPLRPFHAGRRHTQHGRQQQRRRQRLPRDWTPGRIGLRRFGHRQGQPGRSPGWRNCPRQRDPDARRHLRVRRTRLAGVPAVQGRSRGGCGRRRSVCHCTGNCSAPWRAVPGCPLSHKKVYGRPFHVSCRCPDPELGGRFDR
ncbi:hypothetical protein GBAR_LOCUS4150 [Geodia barretti]|uniref:Uncharacterized protein n=1 Tax=Geodia barretti TaxID=519541 RepID=A0AA35R5T4_GEOBA|nr:hypothetical protein GBAR_LOCUS4150 [Geodia barretti]